MSSAKTYARRIVVVTLVCLGLLSVQGRGATPAPKSPISLTIEITGQRSCPQLENLYTEELDLKATFRNDGTSSMSVYPDTAFVWGYRVSKTLEDARLQKFEDEPDYDLFSPPGRGGQVVRLASGQSTVLARQVRVIVKLSRWFDRMPEVPGVQGGAHYLQVGINIRTTPQPDRRNPFLNFVGALSDPPIAVTLPSQPTYDKNCR